MDIFIQVSIGIIAIAFVILIFSIIQTINVLKSTLEELRLSIGQLRVDVSQITVDMKEAIHHTNAMTLDVRTKLNSLDTVFAAANDMGTAMRSITAPVKEAAAGLLPSNNKKRLRAVKAKREKPEADTNRIASAVIDGLLSSIRIWNKMRRT